MPWPIRFGPAAEDEHRRPLARRDLGLLVVGGVVVRRRARRTRRRRCRRSCRPAGCRARAAARARPASGSAAQLADLRGRRSRAAWPGAAASRRARRGRAPRRATSSISGDLVEEPRVDRRSPRPAPRRVAPARSACCTTVEPAVVRQRGLRDEQRVRSSAGGVAAPVERRASGCSSERSAFCSASVKLRPIAIASPTLFMCVVSVGSAPRELLEREPRHLDHDVVERRLERRRRLAGDVVGDLVEGVADRELGGDLRDREAGRLRRQRRRARHPRVHLDDDHAGRRRGLTANWMLQPPVSTPTARMTAMRDVAHVLVLAVGQRHRRRDGDRVAGVHAHRVEVLDRADDHDVVVPVAHQLELVLLPAEDRLLEQHLGGRAGLQPGAGDAAQLGLVVRDARSRRRPS